jgi:hypothetical protein
MTKIQFTKKEFDEMKAAAEVAYKAVEKVHCAYLGTEVFFNAKGLDHIKMKRWNHARPERDQFMRLKLLDLVPGILRASKTLQGIKETRRMERVKMHSRWEERMVRVTYYEFISVVKDHSLNNCRLRVVVKKVDEAPPFFWSIIPYWKQGINAKEMFEGDPEED